MGRLFISSFFNSMVARTAIADMRGRSVSACLSTGVRSALFRNYLAKLFLSRLISLTKTNGAASDASRLLCSAIAILQRRSSDDD